VSDEQRSQAGCPARESGETSGFPGTIRATGWRFKSSLPHHFVALVALSDERGSPNSP